MIHKFWDEQELSGDFVIHADFWAILRGSHSVHPVPDKAFCFCKKHPEDIDVGSVSALSVLGENT